MELLLLGDLPESELRMLLDAPGVLRDSLWIDALRAKSAGVPVNILLHRLQTLQRLLGQSPEWTMNLLYTYKGVLVYELLEIRVPIRKVRKFSGWVRNASSVGSKSSTKKDSPIVETHKYKFDEDQIDYYEFLTVGKLPGLLAGVVS